MNRKQTHTKPSAKKLREQVEHLSVDLEYAGREGDSAYSQQLNNKLDKLYNMLDRIASRGKKV
jgi:pyrroloquinoline quinone (PQQ) biosynthesis protein C